MFRQRKRCYDVTLSRQEGSTTRHLASAQSKDRLAGGDTGRLFLTFGGPVSPTGVSNCPLDRVLTYKNLIYLLNLQFCQLFCGTANKPDHCLILWSERSLNPTDLQDCLYPQPKTRKSVTMAIVAKYCRKSNQLQSEQGYGIHRTHKNICKSNNQKESDAMATLFASYC